MVRLVFAFALLAAPAMADCFGPPIPQVVHFNTGGDATILSSTARDITYAIALPDGTPGTSTLRYGLYPMANANHGVTYHYDWQGDLPNPRNLTPGQRLSLDADLTVEHATTQNFLMDIEVLRDEVIKLDHCPYKVRVIAVTHRLNGQIIGQMTQWLAPDLMFVLRTDVVKPAPAMTFRATALE